MGEPLNPLARAHAICTLAGPIAARWFDGCDPRLRTSRHEAGHAIAGFLLGLHVIEASIVPTNKTSGHAVITTDDQRPIPATMAESTASASPVMSDRRRAVVTLFVFMPELTWQQARAHLKRLQDEARELVWANADLISSLAVELFHAGWMNGAAIEQHIREGLVWRAEFARQVAAARTEYTPPTF